MRVFTPLLPAIGLLALAACATGPTESKAVSACRGAAAAQTSGDLVVVSETPSIEGSTVVLQPSDGGIPWACVVSGSGQVLSVGPSV
ncbi:hypothetical protein [Tropicimonas sp.]|uniref:hypothetical protein n=1 Tax=Tropicimonas sp. TaxID=2067044 RepID=UPI003A895603